MGRVAAWLGAPGAVLVSPSQRHTDILATLLQSVGAGGHLVNDGHLAALAVEHRGTVVSYDNDFGRFAGVRWQPPDSLL